MSRHTATADAPLPLEEFAELAEVDQLKAALAEALDLLEHPERPVAGNRLRRLRRLAGRAEVPGDELLTPEQRRDEGTARAAAKWTPEERALVDEAIRTAARKALEDPANLGNGITADEVWTELADRVPVTKGLTGALVAAANAGVIANTGTTVIAGRGGAHDHGQRLTVWRAIGGDA